MVNAWAKYMYMINYIILLYPNVNVVDAVGGVPFLPFSLPKYMHIVPVCLASAVVLASQSLNLFNKFIPEECSSTSGIKLLFVAFYKELINYANLCKLIENFNDELHFYFCEVNINLRSKFYRNRSAGFAVWGIAVFMPTYFESSSVQCHHGTWLMYREMHECIGNA